MRRRPRHLCWRETLNCVFVDMQVHQSQPEGIPAGEALRSWEDEWRGSETHKHESRLQRLSPSSCLFALIRSLNSFYCKHLHWSHWNVWRLLVHQFCLPPIEPAAQPRSLGPGAHTYQTFEVFLWMGNGGMLGQNSYSAENTERIRRLDTCSDGI